MEGTGSTPCVSHPSPNFFGGEDGKGPRKMVPSHWLRSPPWKSFGTRLLRRGLLREKGIWIPPKRCTRRRVLQTHGYMGNDKMQLTIVPLRSSRCFLPKAFGDGGQRAGKLLRKVSRSPPKSGHPQKRRFCGYGEFDDKLVDIVPMLRRDPWYNRPIRG